jgi:hypothetical protein
MGCQTCGELLTDYKDAVGLFKNAVHNGRIARREDYLLEAGRAARWGRICRDASDALIEHWGKEHPGLAAKAGLS